MSKLRHIFSLGTRSSTTAQEVSILRQSVSTPEEWASSAEEVLWNAQLLERIAGFTPCNDVACSLRFVNKNAYRVLSRPEHVTLRLSQPCPDNVFKRCWGAPDAANSLTLARRLQLLALTAASGRINNFEIAYGAADCVPTGKPMEAAAAANQLVTCQWLLECGCPWGNALSAAAQAGRKKVCKWMLDKGCPWSRDAVCAAARGGHLELMLELLSQEPQQRPGHSRGGDDTVDELLAAAVVGCSLQAFKELYHSLTTESPRLSPRGQEQPQPQPPEAAQEQLQQQPQREGQLSPKQHAAIIDAAAGSPGADWQFKVKWLEEVSAAAPGGCYGAGGGGGSLLQRGRARRVAARTNNIQTDDGGTGGVRALCLSAASEAAQRPDGLARLRWLRDRGYPMAFDRRAFEAAGRNGDVDLARFMLATEAAEAEAVDVDAEVEGRSPPHLFFRHAVEAAAEAGQLDFLKALLRVASPAPPPAPLQRSPLLSPFPSSPLPSSTLLLPLLRASPLSPSPSSPLPLSRAMVASDAAADAALAAAAVAAAVAAVQSDPAAVRGVARHAARGGQLAVLKWAVQELKYDIGNDCEALPEAALCGNLEALNWVWRHTEIHSLNALVRAVEGGCTAVLEWMSSNGFLGFGNPEERSKLYLIAAQNGDLATLSWLRTHQLPPPEDLLSQCVRAKCSGRVLDWLVEKGICAPGSDFSVMVWLHRSPFPHSVSDLSNTTHATSGRSAVSVGEF